MDERPVVDICIFYDAGDVGQIYVLNFLQYIVLASIVVVKGSAVDARQLAQLPDGDPVDAFFL